MMNNDGDIIRGLGFVTLYSAYMEEQLDELLELLDPIEKYDDKKNRWMISQKIKHAKRLLKKLNFDRLNEMCANLDTCKKLFEDRNNVVHGRIYANSPRPDTLQSGRTNVLNRPIESSELYDLAKKFDSLRSKIYGPTCFELEKAITEFLKKESGK